MIVNANYVDHVIKNKNGIMINVNVSVQSIFCVKEIKVGILAHVFVRIVVI